MLMMKRSTYTDINCNQRSKCLLKHAHSPRKKSRRLKTIFLLAAAVFFMAPSAALAVSGTDVVDTAMEYLGYPYAYQSAGPETFDCGGFVWFAFNQAGVDFQLRIESADLAAANTAIYSIDELQPGDILFFGYSADSIYHWGLYAGDGQVIHSYNESTGVVLTPIESVSPPFCYACRLDTLALSASELVNYAYEYTADPNHIPDEIIQIINSRLLPLSFGIDYAMTASELAAISASGSEIPAGLQLETILLPDMKYDLGELAERIAAILSDPDQASRRSSYIALIIDYLPTLNPASAPSTAQ